MKVLLVSLFHPELVRGGAQQVCYELFEGLKARDDVEPFLLSAIDPSFTSLYKSGARITGFDGRRNEFVFLSRDYDYWWHKLSNEHLLAAYAEFLDLVRPDIIHFHHFLLLGLDLFTLTRRVLPNARIVFTLHEFLSLCAADGHMVRRTDGSLCSRPSSVRCHQCFPERGPEQFFMREMWVKRHFEAVDAFTVPARFMIEPYVNWGVDPGKISFVTNGQADYSRGAAASLPPARSASRNRFGFFGQLVDDKGVWVIFEAVAHLRAQGFTDFVVELNGDNLRYASDVRRKEFEAFLEAEAVRPAEERIVAFNGSYHVDQLAQRMARIDWCIVPSVWREAFGLVISEAFMFRKPVLASKIGAMAERVRHEENGLHFAVGDGRALAETIRRCCTEKGLWERIVAGIEPPPPREAMLDGFMKVYAGSAATSLAAEPGRRQSALATLG